MSKTFGDVKKGDKIYCFRDTGFWAREVVAIGSAGMWVTIKFSEDEHVDIQPRKTDTNYEGSYVCIEELIEDVKDGLANAVSFRDKESTHA